MSPIDEHLKSHNIVLPDAMPPVVDGYVPALKMASPSAGRWARRLAWSKADHLHRESYGSTIPGNPMGEYAVDREECKMREYQGGCHCGALGIIYRTEIDPMYWRLRHDGCSFCRRHGVVGTSDAAGNLSVDIQDLSKVRYYRFAHRTADFLICGECGVFVAAIADTAQGKRAVINARVLDGVLLNWASVADVHFDDESPPQRAERRSLHWTPLVR